VTAMLIERSSHVDRSQRTFSRRERASCHAVQLAIPLVLVNMEEGVLDLLTISERDLPSGCFNPNGN
jgi:hypothetical protein